MTHIVQFSGGKDSTALVLWAKENLPEFTAVFCDTGWEHPLTYAYVQHINETLLGGKLVTLRTHKYANGMLDLVAHKQMIPAVRARFCTEELKVLPFIAWMDEQGFGDATVYQGIRADESQARSKMPRRVYNDNFGAWIERPLFDWTAEACFALMKRYGVAPNPLYKAGSARVGCFPCVMVNLGELRRLTHTMPEVWDRILEMEAAVRDSKAANLDSKHPNYEPSFFRNNIIPDRFQTGWREDTGKTYATVADVRRYIESADEDQIRMWGRCTESGCLSVYNLCE